MIFFSFLNIFVLRTWRKSVKTNLFLHRGRQPTTSTDETSAQLRNICVLMYASLRDGVISKLAERTFERPVFSVFYQENLDAAKLAYLDIEKFSWQLSNAETAVRQRVETDTKIIENGCS